MITLHLEIITPDKTVYDGNVYSVTLPSADGEITVLPHHIPIITTVMPGSMVVRAEGGEQIFAVARGVIEIDATSVRVLSDIADRADALEEDEIEKAKLAAEKLMSDKSQDATAFADATALLDRELARLKTVRRYRSRRAFSRTLPS